MTAEPRSAPVTVCLPDEHARALVGEVEGVEFVVWDGSAAPPENLRLAEFLVGSYLRGVPAPAGLTAMPRLRVLQVLSAGVDAWLAVLPPGVVLCNGRGVHGLSTAELAVGLVLAQLRELPRFVRQQDLGVWQGGDRSSLSGRKVLMVGAGDIGGHVRDALTVFGADVTMVGRTARDGVAGFADLFALLPSQDVVVLAVPLTDQTTGLVDRRFLSAMKDHAILVNVGRGATVVTDDLVAELSTGRIFAGLDVTDPEPLPAGHPLWRAPGLLLTPHVGGGTAGWDLRGYALVREQLERFVAGQPLVNVVPT